MSAIRVFEVPAPRMRRLVQLNLGLVLFGVSLAMLVTADLGLDPWDVLHQGIARSLDVRLGAVVVAVSLVVLLVWIPLRQRPGIGTILNAVLVGIVFEATIALFGDASSIGARLAILATAIALNAVATGMYVGAGLGPGPRDGLMTGLAARGHAIGRVRTGIEAAVLGAGWVLGGSVGFGTVIFAFTIGPLVHLTLPIFTISTAATRRPDDLPLGRNHQRDRILRTARTAMDKTFPSQITADGLSIQCWTSTDVDDMHDLIVANIHHLHPWMAWAADEPLTRQQRLDLFEKWEKNRKGGLGGVYSVRTGGQLAGGCALHRRSGPGVIEIGYWLGSHATGQGIATLIARALVDAAFSLDDVQEVRISHAKANYRSGAVAERLGLTRSEHVDHPDNPDATTVWSVTRSQWAEIN